MWPVESLGASSIKDWYTTYPKYCEGVYLYTRILGLQEWGLEISKSSVGGLRFMDGGQGNDSGRWGFKPSYNLLAKSEDNTENRSE